uniref:Uncharacterized protein n=1 Tax=Bionectria ochroleuca TaxID=29856 RepID=A0A0B7K6R7_BIOOC
MLVGSAWSLLPSRTAPLGGGKVLSWRLLVLQVCFAQCPLQASAVLLLPALALAWTQTLLPTNIHKAMHWIFLYYAR